MRKAVRAADMPDDLRAAIDGVIDETERRLDDSALRAARGDYDQIPHEDEHSRAFTGIVNGLLIVVWGLIIPGIVVLWFVS